MEIDLVTLIAQIINLLILLFLLRKFLYLPVLKAVEARQKAVADELQAAEEAQKHAQITIKACEKQTQKLEAQKQEILQKAHQEADDLSAELTAQAQQEYVAAQKQWQRRMAAEQDSFVHTMQKAVSLQFNRFAQKALKQIADVDINDLAVDCLLKQLDNLSPEQQAEYAADFHSKKRIEIQSAAVLSEKNQKKLEKYLREKWQLLPQTQIIFTVNDELICGLSLMAEEQLISWNLEEYMRQFGQNLKQEATQFLNRGKND